MFVTRSKYNALVERFNALSVRWNALVSRINAKGGEEFLQDGRIAPPSPLTDEDITRLLILCHPDKHGGKRLATEMTQRLLELRAKS